jgi:adenine-specific DNA-methyltransferase
LCDEVFGRANYLNQVAIKAKLTAGASGGGEDKKLKKNIEYLLVYAKDMTSFGRFNEVLEETDLLDLIDEMEDDGKSWKYTSVFLGGGTLQEERRVKDGDGNDIVVQRFSGLKRTTINSLVRGGMDRNSAYVEHFEKIFSDTNAQTSIRTRIMDEFGSLAAGDYLVAKYVPRSGRDKGQVATHYYVSETVRRVIWLKDAARKKGRKLVKQERIGTLWSGISWNNVNKEGGVEFSGGKKPEELLRRVIALSTNPGDLVLDSFAGSGSTGAAAHKMGRRWIMVEQGDHCHTHIVPRLKRVIAGADENGITEAVGWKGGGGFRTFKLAPSFIERDQFNQQVISKDYKPEMIQAAMCKHLGYIYAPSTKPDEYWRHGHASDVDFIYVTMNSLNYDGLNALSKEVGDGRTLLVCCKAFNAKLTDFKNLTVKKIPQSVLKNCEWGRDNYSFPVGTTAPDTAGGDDSGGGEEAAPAPRGRRKAAVAPPDVQTAPVKSAPKKMDGTTRAPSKKAQAVVVPPVAAPAPAAKAEKPAKATASAKAPKAANTAAPPKPAGKVATKAVKQTKKAKPVKPRTDNGQGQLL